MRRARHFIENDIVKLVLCLETDSSPKRHFNLESW